MISISRIQRPLKACFRLLYDDDDDDDDCVLSAAGQNRIYISVLIILRVANKSAKIHICLEICSHLYRIVDKFSHYLISLNLNGLWATKREDVGLIVRAISFQD